jgi:hypothetical protein
MAGNKKRSAPPGPHGEAAAKKCKEGEAAGIPSSLPWSADKSVKIWALIAEISQPENYKVLFGKKYKKEVRQFGLHHPATCSLLTGNTPTDRILPESQKIRFHPNWREDLAGIHHYQQKDGGSTHQEQVRWVRVKEIHLLFHAY